LNKEFVNRGYELLKVNDHLHVVVNLEGVVKVEKVLSLVVGNAAINYRATTCIRRKKLDNDNDLITSNLGR